MVSSEPVCGDAAEGRGWTKDPPIQATHPPTDFNEVRWAQHGVARLKR